MPDPKHVTLPGGYLGIADEDGRYELHAPNGDPLGGAPDEQSLREMHAEIYGRTWKCPNCATEHGPIDACFLGVIAAVYEDRHGEMPPTHLLERVDVDLLWKEFGGPAVDWLEDHIREMCV